MTAFLLKRTPHRPDHSGGRVDGRLRSARDLPGRPCPADARHGGDARGTQRVARTDGTEPADCLALSLLDWRTAHRRFRTLLHIFRAGSGSDCERVVVSLPLAILSLLLSTLIAIPVGVFSAERRGRLGDTMTMGIAQVGRRHPELLVRLDAGLHLCRMAAAGAGRRFSRLERRCLAGEQGAHSAGHRAGAAAGGYPGARHPFRADRNAGRRLYPHCPRQGPATAVLCCGGTRCAMR